MSSEPCYTGLALKGVGETACKKDRSSSGESEADMGSVLFSCMLQE